MKSASKGVREALAIIRAVVALAKSLGMATTADGVETEAEHRLVEELGCSKVQGYYFGRPSIERPWLVKAGPIEAAPASRILEPIAVAS